jgi:glycosyltransferase involved in cell wall biosynthesis
MKILFVLDRYEVGGITTSIQTQTRYLYEASHKSIVLGAHTALTGQTTTLFPNSTVYGFALPATSAIVEQILIVLKTFIYIRRIIVDENPDIIHFNHTLSTLGGSAYCLLVKKPFIIEYSGAWDLEINSTVMYLHTKTPLKRYQILIHNIKSSIRKFLQQWCLLHASTVISLSKYAKQQLIHHFHVPEKNVVIIPGTVSIRSLNRSDRNKAKLLLDIHPSTMVISLISRWEPRKNIHTLIPVVTRLMQRYDCLFILGIPDYCGAYFNSFMEDCMKTVANMTIPQAQLFFRSLVLHNAISPKQRATLMRASDIFLMISSDLETFGFTTIEAINNGSIVVGTPSGATPEILGQIRSAALLTKSASAQDIADKIEEIITLSPKQRHIIRKKAHDVIKLKYNSRMTLPKLLFVYNQIMNNSS